MLGPGGCKALIAVALTALVFAIVIACGSVLFFGILVVNEVLS